MLSIVASTILLKTAKSIKKIIKGGSRLKNFILFNMTMNPGPSIEEYVNEIKKILKIKSFTPSVPKFLLLIFSFVIELFAKPLGIKHPFSPVRIHKLSNSNNILPTYLINHGYTFKYTLEEALRDWKDD